jgi:hypothetical protein
MEEGEVEAGAEAGTNAKTGTKTETETETETATRAETETEEKAGAGAEAASAPTPASVPAPAPAPAVASTSTSTLTPAQAPAAPQPASAGATPPSMPTAITPAQPPKTPGTPTQTEQPSIMGGITNEVPSEVKIEDAKKIKEALVKNTTKEVLLKICEGGVKEIKAKELNEAVKKALKEKTGVEIEISPRKLGLICNELGVERIHTKYGKEYHLGEKAIENLKAEKIQ